MFYQETTTARTLLPWLVKEITIEEDKAGEKV